MTARFGDKAPIVKANDAEDLKKLAPDGKWRIGAFEVVDLQTGRVLYSKLESGEHVVDDESKLNKLLDEVEQVIE